MRIAIISDSHDNLANLKKVLDWLKKNKIAALIHCGDVFRKETVSFISQNFKGKIYISLADVDDDIKRIPRVKIYEKFGELKKDGKKIAFCHFPEKARELANSQKLAPYRAAKGGSDAGYDLVFYGHLHKPWKTKIRKTILANPGNVAGIFFKPTFAVYDTKTDKLDLKILEKLS